jgi:hypothetical protein
MTSPAAKVRYTIATPKPRGIRALASARTSGFRSSATIEATRKRKTA